AVVACIHGAMDGFERRTGVKMDRAAVGGGKMLRPAFLFAAARCAVDDGAAVGIGDETYRRLLHAAAGLETLHTASLVHDDIIDRAEVRRGKPTISARLGNHAAIATGDLLFGVSGELCAAVGNPAVTRIFAEAASNLAAGQIREMNFDGQATPAAQRLDYLAIAGLKTAALYECACRAACQVAGRPGLAARWGTFGREFGLAFQISDDLIDLGVGAEAGKPILQDLRNRKPNLAVILALGDPRVRRSFGQLWGDASAVDLEELGGFVRESEGPRRAAALALDHLRACDEHLEPDRASPHAAFLVDLVEAMRGRLVEVGEG
ncbi:MAG TPA: polyprenyl synthetase family protein, partial [Opitutaceae bacterium]|nr:polyprenyl synthetase family protein [Opitutaceae bacterium]